jgi:hypothetical protein
MATNKKKALPVMDSIAKLVEHFDTHDMGELWDQMPEAARLCRDAPVPLR